MKKTRVLVTGGSGFFGSHLCDRLIKDGVNLEEGLAKTIEYFKQIL